MKEIDKAEQDKTNDLICEIIHAVLRKIHEQECHNRRINMYSNIAAGLLSFALEFEIDPSEKIKFLEQVDRGLKKSKGFPK